jgi:GNAT superfamily N-acetyltransferase
VIASSGPAASSHRHNERDTTVRLRPADADDAAPIASLHADSWRRHYRGAYADSFLDSDVAADRRSVWSARLDATLNSRTFVAEAAGRMVGFIHVIFDHDPQWGSLVDNLHVTPDKHRTGIGTKLLSHAARTVVERARTNQMYLWVLEQNTAAQHFYRASGATCVETAAVSPPGGDPSRLHGTPRKLRMAWHYARVHIV